MRTFEFEMSVAEASALMGLLDPMRSGAGGSGNRGLDDLYWRLSAIVRPVQEELLEAWKERERRVAR